MSSQIKLVRGLAALVAWLALSGSLAAAPLYRCGSDGSTTAYSDRADQACGHNTVALTGVAQPSTERVRAAQQVAQRDRALAAQLRSERLERERLPPGAGAAAEVKSTTPGLSAANRMAPASSNTLQGRPELGRTKGKRGTPKQKDPRVTFEAKVPAPAKQSASKASRVKAVKSPG